MPSLSKESQKKLNTCDYRIQNIINEAIQIYDFTVLCGVRTKEEQEQAYLSGNSKVKWPESKHNIKTGRNEKASFAIDIAPYPINWNSLKEFYFLAGIILAIAKQHRVKLRWGGDFNRDYNFNNDKFLDLPHFELED